MKSFIVMGVFLALVSCGKDKDSGSSASGFSISALQDRGIILQSYGQGLVVLCTSNNRTTNQQRLEVITKMLNDLQRNPSKQYKVNNQPVDSYRLGQVLGQAASVLQQGSGLYQQNSYMPSPYYQQNPFQQNQNQYLPSPYGSQNTNTQCPNQVLAQG